MYDRFRLLWTSVLLSLVLRFKLHASSEFVILGFGFGMDFVMLIFNVFVLSVFKKGTCEVLAQC